MRELSVFDTHRHTLRALVALELVTPLPPGASSHTRLAKHGARLVVLREIKDGTDCSWPPPAPRLVTLQEVGELQGKRHALFEWVPGVTLRETLRALEAAGNPIPLGLVGRVVLDAARALEGIVPARAHGGVQDAAMQIGFDGVISVLDFGAPRLSRFRPLGRVNFTADVFALGAVLHSALTGFQGDYAGAPPSLAMPSQSHPEATPAVDAVLQRALSAQPDSRQPDAGTFADELEAVLGDALFSHAQVAEIVRALFRERIKLLQSLGSLEADGAGQNLEAVLPVAAIPSGTQPGVGGPPLTDAPNEPTLPRIPAPLPPKPMLPWDSGESLTPASEPPSEPTLPRVASSELVPRAPEPASEPTLPRVASSELVPRAQPEDLDHDEGARTAAVSPQELAAAQRARKPLTELDTNPRAQPTSDDTNPRARPLADVDTNPRAQPPAADDTNPRVRPPVTEDTAPRARVRAPDEDVGPRNTTESERLRARGQERLRTPPQGVPAIDDDDALGAEAPLGAPTAVHPKLKVDPRQTAATLTPAPEPEDDEAPPRRDGAGGLRVAMVVLLFIVVGLAVGVVLKLKRAQELATEPPPTTQEDGPLDAEPADAAVADAVLAAGDLDAGAEDAGSEDAGVEDAGAEDAGTIDAGMVDAGTIDAGTVDAGTQPPKRPTKKPTKKPVKKKKRR